MYLCSNPTCRDEIWFHAGSYISDIFIHHLQYQHLQHPWAQRNVSVAKRCDLGSFILNRLRKKGGKTVLEMVIFPISLSLSAESLPLSNPNSNLVWQGTETGKVLLLPEQISATLISGPPMVLLRLGKRKQHYPCLSDEPTSLSLLLL